MIWIWFGYGKYWGWKYWGQKMGVNFWGQNSFYDFTGSENSRKYLYNIEILYKTIMKYHKNSVLKIKFLKQSRIDSGWIREVHGNKQLENFQKHELTHRYCHMSYRKIPDLLCTYKNMEIEYWTHNVFLNENIIKKKTSWNLHWS